MIKVTIKGLDPDSGDVKVYGTIAFRNGVLSTSSDIPVLRNMVKTPVMISIGGKPLRIYPQDDPEVFIRNLYLQYRSPYLQASKPQEGEFDEVSGPNAVPQKGSEIRR